MAVARVAAILPTDRHDLVTVGHWREDLRCHLGLLRIGRPDTIGPADPGRRVEPGAALASHRMNMDHDALPGDHPETGHVSTGALPPDTDVQALISAGYERYRHLGEGAVADYIPALAAASPSAFGVCVAGVRGRLFSAGDADQEFAIESISKLLSSPWSVTASGMIRRAGSWVSTALGCPSTR
jgi:glutaminase